MSEFRASDASAVDRLVEEVLSRLGVTANWNQGGECRLVKVEEEAHRFRYIIECGADRLGLRASAEGEFDRELARRIDHTLLRANATGGEVRRLCEEALEYGFAAVCINPAWVRLAHSILQGSPVSVCTVAGFPLGAGTSDIKAFETRRAVFDGANEVDMVINVGALKDGDDNLVREDIRGVVKACHENGAICKVIIEAAFLSDEEKVKACVLSKEAGADFVKTSTGFGPGGATAEDVALMRRVVGPALGVKAAGGIKDSAETKKMIEAGATRIGASAGVKIVKGEKSDGRY